MQNIERIDEAFVEANSVASLPDRPNDVSRFGGGMSAAELKARYDALAKAAIAKVNELVDAVNAEDGESALLRLLNTPVTVAEQDAVRTMTLSEWITCLEGEGLPLRVEKLEAFRAKVDDIDGMATVAQNAADCAEQARDEAEELLAGKLDKTAAEGTYRKLLEPDPTGKCGRLYAVGNAGAQSYKNYTKELLANSIPERGMEGSDSAGTFKVADPTLPEHPATKGYADALLAAIGVATKDADGYMSKEDKAHLDTLVTMLNGSDPAVVDTLAEVLAVFDKYPQGASVAEAIAGKLDKTGGTMSGVLVFDGGLINNNTSHDPTKGIVLGVNTIKGTEGSDGHRLLGFTGSAVQIGNAVDSLHLFGAHNRLKYYSARAGFKDLAFVDDIYPVGAIYLSMSDTSPASFIGGTWEKIAGKFLIGAGSGYTVGSEGGEKQVSLTAYQLAPHTHEIVLNENGQYELYAEGSGLASGDGAWAYTFESKDASSGDSDVMDGFKVVARESGYGQAHNNMPPYLAVNMWKRVE